MFAGSVVVLMLAQAPEQAAWTMELGGVPAAVVRARRDGDRFHWSVEHLFGRRARDEASVDVDRHGLMPEGLWFWKRPPFGCRKGFDELTGREGVLCRDRGDGGTDPGTALGAPFEATWGADDVLQRLSTRSAVYTLGEVWQGEDPWAKGIAVEGTGPRIGLRPTPGLVVQRPVAPRAAGTAPPGKDCLTLALDAEKASGGKKVVVLGLVVEGGRAFPHAWTRELKSGEEEDLAVPAGEVPARTYLALERREAGRVYLELLAGRMTLARSP